MMNVLELEENYNEIAGRETNAAKENTTNEKVQDYEGSVEEKRPESSRALNTPPNSLDLEGSMVTTVMDEGQIQNLVQEAANIFNEKFRKAENILKEMEKDLGNEDPDNSVEISIKKSSTAVSIQKGERLTIENDKETAVELVNLKPKYGKHIQIKGQEEMEKLKVGREMLEESQQLEVKLKEERIIDSSSNTEPELHKQVAIQQGPSSLNSDNDLVQKLRVIQSKATKQKLITASHYNGVWQDALQCMDGYGIYTYPDGSEYRGYFSRGNFNGYGTLHLTSPYNFTFKGTFIDGLIHEIEDMWFDDGLHVNASFDGWSADFSQWKYCCPTDRRYAAEQLEGLPAVGPYSFLTSKQPPRELHKYYFDLEEGVYNPSSGLIINRPKPFTNMAVPCKDHVDWIVENCRHYSGANMEVPGHVCHQILRNNLDTELALGEHVASCNYDQTMYRKRYFAKLCKEQPLANKCHPGVDFEDSEGSVAHPLPDSSVTNSSFSDRSLSIDVQEYLEVSRQYGNLKLGRDLERETLGLMSEPYKRDSNRSSTSYG